MPNLPRLTDNQGNAVEILLATLSQFVTATATRIATEPTARDLSDSEKDAFQHLRHALQVFAEEHVPRIRSSADAAAHLGRDMDADLATMKRGLRPGLGTPLMTRELIAIAAAMGHSGELSELPSVETLVADISQLRSDMVDVRMAVTEWVAKREHDHCHYYPDIFERLASILDIPLTVDPKTLPPERDFARFCEVFRRDLYGQRAATTP